jgi:hypothetical protein
MGWPPTQPTFWIRFSAREGNSREGPTSQSLTDLTRGMRGCGGYAYALASRAAGSMWGSASSAWVLRAMVPASSSARGRGQIHPHRPFDDPCGLLNCGSAHRVRLEVPVATRKALRWPQSAAGSGRVRDPDGSRFGTAKSLGEALRPTATCT